MIIRATKETMRQWRQGKWRVCISVHANFNPFGYCEGTFEDERMLMALGFMAMIDDAQIIKRPIKGGRQVWSVQSKTLDTVACVLVGWRPKSEIDNSRRFLSLRDTFDNSAVQGLLDLNTNERKAS